MPQLQRKRRSAPDPSEDISSPEPATQRRRTTNQPARASSSDEDEEAPATQTNTAQANTTHETRVKNLVRFALASELTRRPIRRADINDKCLGAAAGSGRNFKEVFAAAQLQLRDVFGMELAEAPAKENTTLAQKRAAVRSQTQASQRGGGALAGPWFLVSCLGPELRGCGNVLGLEGLGGREAEEEKYRAVYTVLCSLVALSGGSMAENKLSRYLRRLGLEDGTPLKGVRAEGLFKRLEREGYVVRVKERSSAGGEDDVSFVLGPRGKVEVGEVGARGLVERVYGVGEGLDGREEQELARRVDRSLGVEERAKRREAEQERAARAGAPQKKSGRGKGKGKKRAAAGEDESEEEEDEDDEEE